jgi:hypothetical protein
LYSNFPFGTFLNCRCATFSKISSAELSSSVQSICFGFGGKLFTSQGGKRNFFQTGLANVSAWEDTLPVKSSLVVGWVVRMVTSPEVKKKGFSSAVSVVIEGS